MTNYEAPAWQKDAFNCPHCGAFASQTWWDIERTNFSNSTRLTEWGLALCSRCRNYSMWCDEKMIIPSSGNSPLPHPDMPENVSVVFQEARSIANLSPKGAAALLRLALQQLCIDLGQEGKNINKDIGELVKNGLQVEVQQALDVVRVVGNNAVHPGEIRLDDSPEVANSLFELINYIVDRMISQPKKLSELYASLPAGALEGIKKRDGEAS
ncbi:MAG: DUF4145 domain-containing protein [Proteobacteria bacterium]|nr:DUF4145 domain-containing protein [Pseudomonadota bacterium]MBU1451065.1 DUF4145 domain-containing protein [Pseudomonadota bacterium]MBU2467801.1 DUF4145 domain-containing protein [Pseudomonadota bacterium]MBU2517799.1 DUF4145 domain-containing protein [Pseudomonadota bacterium]